MPPEFIKKNDPKNKNVQKHSFNEILEIYNNTYQEYINGLAASTSQSEENETIDRIVSKIIGSLILRFFSKQNVTDCLLFGWIGASRVNAETKASFSRVHAVRFMINGRIIIIDTGGLSGTSFNFIRIESDSNEKNGEIISLSQAKINSNDFTPKTAEDMKIAETSQSILSGLEKFGLFLLRPNFPSQATDVICCFGHRGDKHQPVPECQYIFPFPSNESCFNQDEFHQLSEGLLDIFTRYQFDEYSPTAPIPIERIKEKYNQRVNKLKQSLELFEKQYGPKNTNWEEIERSLLLAKKKYEPNIMPNETHESLNNMTLNDEIDFISSIEYLLEKNPTHEMVQTILSDISHREGTMTYQTDSFTNYTTNIALKKNILNDNYRSIKVHDLPNSDSTDIELDFSILDFSIKSSVHPIIQNNHLETEMEEEKDNSINNKKKITQESFKLISKNNSAIISALPLNQEEPQKYISCDPNIVMGRKLIATARQNQLESVSIILKQKNLPSAFVIRALEWASYDGHFEMMSLILNEKIFLNLKDLNYVKCLEILWSDIINYCEIDPSDIVNSIDINILSQKFKRSYVNGLLRISAGSGSLKSIKFILTKYNDISVIWGPILFYAIEKALLCQEHHNQLVKEKNIPISNKLSKLKQFNDKPQLIIKTIRFIFEQIHNISAFTTGERKILHTPFTTGEKKILRTLLGTASSLLSEAVEQKQLYEAMAFHDQDQYESIHFITTKTIQSSMNLFLNILGIIILHNGDTPNQILASLQLQMDPCIIWDVFDEIIVHTIETGLIDITKMLVEFKEKNNIESRLSYGHLLNSFITNSSYENFIKYICDKDPILLNTVEINNLLMAAFKHNRHNLVNFFFDMTKKNKPNITREKLNLLFPNENKIDEKNIPSYMDQSKSSFSLFLSPSTKKPSKDENKASINISPN